MYRTNHRGIQRARARPRRGVAGALLQEGIDVAVILNALRALRG
jgi:hypothetical protein